MGRERNTDHRSDIRAQRGGMIPCVPSQDLCGVSTPNFGTRRLSDIGEMPRYRAVFRPLLSAAGLDFGPGMSRG